MIVDPRSSRPVEAALAYLRAGVSIVPMNADGSKAPALKTWIAERASRGGDR